MMLSPREIDKMLIYSVADLAKKRKSRGLKTELFGSSGSDYGGNP